MAVTSVPISDTLNIVVDNGLSASGGQLTKTMKYANVKPDATDAAVKTVADAIVAAQTKTLIAVNRAKNAELQGTP
ncbi:MAG: DUF1659 domain-containing protein [Syntrophomonas sp.]